jgi:solute carrier family 8 (sodium/calcium exchanger)
MLKHTHTHLIEYGGGWACFLVSIILIGVLTALIGDLAAHFGCTIGLKDSVNALSLIALGTSLPGEGKYTSVVA